MCEKKLNGFNLSLIYNLQVLAIYYLDHTNFKWYQMFWSTLYMYQQKDAVVEQDNEVRYSAPDFFTNQKLNESKFRSGFR